MKLPVFLVVLLGISGIVAGRAPAGRGGLHELWSTFFYVDGPAQMQAAVEKGAVYGTMYKEKYPNSTEDALASWATLLQCGGGTAAAFLAGINPVVSTGMPAFSSAYLISNSWLTPGSLVQPRIDPIVTQMVLGGALAVVRGWDIDSPAAIGGVMLIVLGDVTTADAEDAMRSAGKALLSGERNSSPEEIDQRVGDVLASLAGWKPGAGFPDIPVNMLWSIPGIGPILNGILGVATNGRRCYAASHAIDRALRSPTRSSA